MDILNINPLVSVAIPAYKATFLKSAIESVINQTYKNLEIIIVNDRSPENLDGIVAKFSDHRIKYFTNNINIGGLDPVANWNKCLSLCSGEYFALLCDDDVYEPTFIEKLLQLSVNYPNCNVFRARAKIIDGQGKIISYYPTSPEFEDAVNYLIDLEGGYRLQTISEFLFKRKYIVNLGGYTPLPMAWYADHLSIVKFAQNGGIASSSEFLINFRLSGQNITSQSQSYILEKIKANKIYSKWIYEYANTIELTRRIILITIRKAKEYNSILSIISKAKFKTILYLWIHKNMLGISNKCLISGLVTNIKSRLSRIVFK